MTEVDRVAPEKGKRCPSTQGEHRCERSGVSEHVHKCWCGLTWGNYRAREHWTVWPKSAARNP